jgi:hypothetical protein
MLNLETGSMGSSAFRRAKGAASFPALKKEGSVREQNDLRRRSFFGTMVKTAKGDKNRGKREGEQG